LPQQARRNQTSRPQDTGRWPAAFDYRELGEAYLDQIDQTGTAATSSTSLERLGYVVSIQPKEAAIAARYIGRSRA
jgi:hypothetical protein